MRRREFLKIGVGLVVGQLANPFPGFSAGENTFTVGQSKAVTMVPNIVCPFKGFDVECGVKIEPKIFSSGQGASEALVSGNVDAAFCGDAPSLTLYAVGAPIKTVMVSNYGGDPQAIVVRAGSGITKAAQLRGKRIGGTAGTGTHRFLLLVLEKERIVDTIQFYNMKTEDIASALATNQIDATMGWEPWPTLWEKTIQAKVIVRGGDLIAAPMMIHFSDKLIRNHRELAYRMVLAYIKTQHYIRTGNRKEIVDFVCKTYKAEEEEVSRSIRMLKYDPRLSPYILQDLKDSALFMIKIKKLDRVPDIEKFFQRDFVERARKEHPELFKDLA